MLDYTPDLGGGGRRGRGKEGGGWKGGRNPLQVK